VPRFPRHLLLALLAAAALWAPVSARGQEPRLFYETDGAGPPVVFVPDWAADTSIWFLVVPPLRPRFELIRYDLRGQGRSEAPADGVYSLEAHAADLGRLLDGLGIERAHLVGAGLGAAVALTYAERHPDRTRSVVAIQPHIAWDTDARQAWGRFVEAYGRSDHPPLSEYTSVVVGRWFGARFPDEEPWVVPFVDLMLSRQEGSPLVASLRAWLGSELALTSRSDVPVLLVWGQRAGPPEEEARLHGAFPVRRHMIEGAGAAPHVEAPGETAAAIASFLSEVDGAAP
jgi:3-oxoadipate enol-lactonase